MELSFAWSQMFCELCFLLCEYHERSGDILFVLALNMLNRNVKLRDSVQGAGADALLEFHEQKGAVIRAIEQSPVTHRETLLNHFFTK